MLYIELQENQSSLNKKTAEYFLWLNDSRGVHRRGGGGLKRSQTNKFLVREDAVRGAPAALYGEIVDVTKGF